MNRRGKLRRDCFRAASPFGRNGFIHAGVTQLCGRQDSEGERASEAGIASVISITVRMNDVPHEVILWKDEIVPKRPTGNLRPKQSTRNRSFQ